MHRRSQILFHYNRHDYSSPFTSNLFQSSSSLSSPLPIFADGTFHASNNNNFETIDTFNPGNGKVIGKLSLADEAMTQHAINVAREAYESTMEVLADGKEGDELLIFNQRKEILNHFADSLEKDFGFISQLETLDCGKPLEEAKFDVTCSINCLRYYASLLPSAMMTLMRKDNNGENNNKNNVIDISKESEDKFSARRIRQPLGVAALITPFNYPLLMSVWKIAPAIASGCSVIHKPAEQTSLSALRFAEYFQDYASRSSSGSRNNSSNQVEETQAMMKKTTAAINGIFQVLPGRGSSVGEQLVTSPKVDKISFTGSTQTGMKILEKSSVFHHSTKFKRVSLELGGKSPLVVEKDGDLDLAVDAVIANIFGNAGQICTASSRVFCHEEIQEEFISKLVHETEKRLNLGDCSGDGSLTLGPVISKEQKAKVEEYIRIGKEDDKATLVDDEFFTKKFQEQMKRPENKDGYFIAPTIFRDVTDSMKIAKEEIFGPVLCIMTPFSDQDFRLPGSRRLIERCNNSSYGLAAGIFTKDKALQQKFCRGVHAGNVWVNEAFGYSFDPVPFGGLKMSGIGKELGGKEGIYSYCEEKSVISTK